MNKKIIFTLLLFVFLNSDFSYAQELDEDGSLYIKEMSCASPEVTVGGAAFAGARLSFQATNCRDQDNNAYRVIFSKLGAAIGVGGDLCFGFKYLYFQNLKLSRMDQAMSDFIFAREEEASSGMSVNWSEFFGGYIGFDFLEDENSLQHGSSIGAGFCVGAGFSFSASMWDGDSDDVAPLPALYHIRVELILEDSREKFLRDLELEAMP